MAVGAKVASSLTEILGKARQVDELVGQIANGSHEPSQGITQINLAVTEMDRVTQNNAARAEESASALRELRQQSGCFRSAIGSLNQLVGSGNQTQAEPSTPIISRYSSAVGQPSNGRNKPSVAGKQESISGTSNRSVTMLLN